MTKNPFLFLTIVLWLVTSAIARAEAPIVDKPLAPVTLQLKWLHQFQFAGYYAARQQGYYAEEGLDVEIKQREPGQNFLQNVISGQTDFAIGDSGIIAHYAKGEPFVALAAIFQHDALVLFSKQKSGIISPYEMAGKRIMYDVLGENNAPVRAMLAEANLDEQHYTAIDESFNIDDVISGKVDVMSGYLTDKPFEFRQRGIKVNIINPQNYGVDFYGDLLFTSRNELTRHPGRAERFRRASLKGWQYALDHPEETIQLIKRVYHSKRSLQQLRFEAAETRKLIMPDSIQLGQIETGRLRRVAATYTNLKLAPPLTDEQLNAFINPLPDPLGLTDTEREWLDKHHLIRVGIDRDFAPYEWLEPQGNYVGMVAEHLHLVENKLGVRFEIIKDKSWQQILDMAQRGEIDMIVAAVKTADRDQYLNFTPIYVNTPAVIIGGDGHTGYFSALSMAASNAHPQLLGILQKAQDSIPQNQRDAIINRWMGLTVTQGVGAETLLKYATATLAILLLFVYWVFRLRREVGARRRSEAELSMLYSNMSLGFALQEAVRDDQGKIIDYRYLEINPAFERITGIPRQQWLGKTTKQLQPTCDSWWVEHFADVEANGKAKHFENHCANEDRWFESDSYQAGSKRFVTLLQDITERKRDELALKASEERLRISQYYGGVGTWEYDMLHNRQIWSEIVTNGLGFPKAENPTWAHFLATVCNEDRPLVVQAMRQHLDLGGKFDVEYRINVSGQQCWMRSVGQVERDINGKPLRMLGIVQDISERKQAEEKLRLSARVFSDAHEGIIITNAEALIVDVNAAFTEITGYSREEVIGKNPNMLKSGQQSPDFYLTMWRSLHADGHWQGEIWNRKKNGEMYAELLTISALRDRQGNVIHFIGLFSDITESKQQQQELELLAHYDPLTKLPNRSLFADRFNQAIAHSKRNDSLLAVCYLDLDGFKQVNDTFGHEVGDELLIEVARRIKLTLREFDTVCRLGGDEFAVLFENIQSIQQCEDTLKRIHHALADGFNLNNRQIRIAASSGVTIYPLDREEPDILLRHADQAMYQAKLAGRNCYRIYQQLLDSQSFGQFRHTGRLEQAIDEIQQALADKQFCLYYQPKVNIATGEIVGAEVLIRWQHPQRGVLLPCDFLPIIEATPLEIELSNWTLRQAFQQLQKWQELGLTLQVSVNVSPHFLQAEHFFTSLESLLSQYPAISSRQLELEILENSVLDDLIAVGEILKQCHQLLGVTCALDDFGTGYSSLTHLRHLTINSVKIDQTFVRDMIDYPDDQSIVESIIGLANAFKREVVAEGVETIEHGIFLLNLGCNLAQGYAIARPMQGEAIPNWVKNYQNPKAWNEQANNRLNGWQSQLLLLKLQQHHWLNKLQAIVQIPGNSPQHWPIINAKKSHLGKWLQRVSLKRSLDPQLLMQLEQNHRRQCMLAEKLRQLHAEAETASTKTVFSELLKVSITIEQLLRQLDNQDLIPNKSIANS